MSCQVTEEEKKRLLLQENMESFSNASSKSKKKGLKKVFMGFLIFIGILLIVGISFMMYQKYKNNLLSITNTVGNLSKLGNVNNLSKLGNVNKLSNLSKLNTNIKPSLSLKKLQR